MRFNYAGKAQSEGRIRCEICKKRMLGVGEIDWSTEYSSLIFCECPEDSKEDAVTIPHDNK